MVSFREPFPIIHVDDVHVEFYRSAFGCEIGFRWPNEGPLSFAFLRLDPLGIGIGRRHEHGTGDLTAPQAPPLHRLGPRLAAALPSVPSASKFELCLYTDHVDAAAATLRAAWAEEVMPARDEPWAERRAYFRDLDGHLIHLAERL